MIKPKILFKITFPKCGHTQKGYRVDNETAEEEVRSYIIEKFEGYCGECYAEKCKKEGKLPWYEK